MLWLFGVFLIYTGIKLALHSDSNVDPEKNVLMRLARRLFPVASGSHEDKFFVVENGRRAITPLFLVLLVVESTDVLFAVDSVPAIFGIAPNDPFIVFSSNIFAILGLRALYFLLAGAIELFRYLNYGLAAVLVFVGAKMVAWYWLGLGIVPLASLLVILALLAISIAASLIALKRQPEVPGASPGPE